MHATNTIRRFSVVVKVKCVLRACVSLEADAPSHLLQWTKHVSVSCHFGLLCLDFVEEIDIRPSQFRLFEAVLERLHAATAHLAVVEPDKNVGKACVANAIFGVLNIDRNATSRIPIASVGVTERTDTIACLVEDFVRKMMIGGVDERCIKDETCDHVNRIKAVQAKALVVDTGVGIDGGNKGINGCRILKG
jgi:hypothetical protein